MCQVGGWPCCPVPTRIPKTANTLPWHCRQLSSFALHVPWVSATTATATASRARAMMVLLEMAILYCDWSAGRIVEGGKDNHRARDKRKRIVTVILAQKQRIEQRAVSAVTRPETQTWAACPVADFVHTQETRYTFCTPAIHSQWTPLPTRTEWNAVDDFIPFVHSK